MLSAVHLTPVKMDSCPLSVISILQRWDQQQLCNKFPFLWQLIKKRQQKNNSCICCLCSQQNTTALGPGEKEPVCGRHPHGHGGPPPHAHDHGRGPPPDAAKGRPPHAHGPPPHADKGGRPPHAHDHGHGPPPTGGKGKGSFHPLRRFHPCHGFLVNPDPALHPICPWPLPHRPHN